MIHLNNYSSIVLVKDKLTTFLKISLENCLKIQMILKVLSESKQPEATTLVGSKYSVQNLLLSIFK